MSNYIVTGTDLTSVANAIRAKSGTSEQLVFPSGFVSAVEAIQTGGGDDTLTKLLTDSLTEYVNDTVTNLKAWTFNSSSNLKTVRCKNVISVGEYAFSGSGIQTLYLPNASINGDLAPNCKSLDVAVVKSLTAADNFRHIPSSKTSINTLDLTHPGKANIGGRSMYGCEEFSTIVIRGNSVCGLYSTNAFDYTQFASGGAGGIIYIPKTLYDHLGDGSALDYKAATNWSVIDGYGTITWAKIEGSQYEHYYADGTPIT